MRQKINLILLIILILVVLALCVPIAKSQKQMNDAIHDLMMQVETLNRISSCNPSFWKPCRRRTSSTDTTPNTRRPSTFNTRRSRDANGRCVRNRTIRSP